jgi:amidophosphoribosyltransferase
VSASSPSAIRTASGRWCSASAEGAAGTDYMIASESVALDILGFELIRDVAPGECVFISNEGELHTRICAEQTVLSPCIFELVYLARPDSIMDDISVYKSRLRMGEHLASRILERFPRHDHDIDVVVPIPDTGAHRRVAARLPART